MLDVVIVGAGPAGSRAAYKLAELGYHVAVLEKRITIGEKLSCTGIISQECVNTFAISPEVIFRAVNSARIFSYSGESIRVYRPENQACIVDRKAFDQALAVKAQLKGAEYHLSTKVDHITVTQEKVVITAEQKGETKELEAQALVIAAGFNSSLVKELRFGKVGFVVGGAQIDVRIKGLEEVEVYFDQELAPGFFSWLVPTSNGKCLAGLLSRHSPGAHLRDWIASLRDQGRIICDSASASPIHYGGIPLKPLSRTFSRRVLVVGDAAGQVKPTTGGGIYFGMLCADIAASTLHNAIKSGDLSADNLSDYEKNWRKKLGQELRIEYFARRLYQHLTDKQIEGVFRYLKSTGAVDSLLKDDKLSFDWHGGLTLKILRSGLMSRAKKAFKFRTSHSDG